METTGWDTAFGSVLCLMHKQKEYFVQTSISHCVIPLLHYYNTFNNINLNHCSPCVLEHEWCHGSVAQAADWSGCEREVHGGASLRVHPRMHCVWSARHPSLPRLAGWPPGETDLTHHCCFSLPPRNKQVFLALLPILDTSLRVRNILPSSSSSFTVKIWQVDVTLNNLGNQWPGKS